MPAFSSLRARFLPPLLAAALLVFCQWRSGLESPLLVVGVTALIAYVAFAAGRLLAPGAGAPAAWTLGVIATCLGIYVLTLVLPLTAGAIFVALGAVVVALDLWRKRLPAENRETLLGFALCVAFAAAWCAGPAGAWQAVQKEGVLPLWSDYFFHGGLISQFGDLRALGRGSIYLADHPSSFYHFASYGLAAAAARLLDQPGLPMAASVWLPIGFLAMLGGAYALGERLAGAAGGIAAIAALAILPDASNYGLRNGWFSFHWNLFAHAGATYALGAAFLSLALLERRNFAASAALAAAALFFRFHIFVLLAPAWLAAAVACSIADPARRRRAGWLMIALLGGGAGALSLALMHLNFWRAGEPALAHFLVFVHTAHEPTAYTGWFAALQMYDSDVLTLGAGVGLTLVAALGAFLVLLPAAALVARERGALRPIDAAIAYLAFCWVLLLLFAPTPWHGDPSDLIHRPLVLLYAACAVWTLCLAIRMVRRPLWPALAALAVVALPAVSLMAGPMSKPKFAWGVQDDGVRITPGLAEAAAYLRSHALPGVIYVASGLSADYATFDISTQLCSMSGVPAFLSRPYFERIKDGPRKALVEERFAAVKDPATPEALRQVGVQWYVVTGEKGPRWDPARAAATFKAGQVSLYRTP
jgi:hypothetical protein